jgi:pSer/pThr/pTyr-binding forkhead associated (FHA) protein
VRGWLTLAAEGVHLLVGGVDDWPSLLPIRPAHSIPGPKYLLIDGQAGGCYPLRTGLNTIGRLPDNDIVLEGSTVSRRHCVILVHVRGACELHDTASRNGTFVNGQPFRQPIRLASGDEIRISQRLFLLVSESDCQAAVEADTHPNTVLDAEQGRSVTVNQDSQW